MTTGSDMGVSSWMTVKHQREAAAVKSARASESLLKIVGQPRRNRSPRAGAVALSGRGQFALGGTSMKRVLALAAVAFLIATPIAIAQPTQTPPPETPPTTAAPPRDATHNAADTTQQRRRRRKRHQRRRRHATSRPPAPEGCRTRQPAGEQCACLSDTSRIGTSTRASGRAQRVCATGLI